MSNYNAWGDRMLAANLNLDEYRLAGALQRLILGYHKTEARLGRKLLMETAHFTDTRSFQRARDGLVEKGLLRYQAGGNGKGGRGHRGLYTLLLETPTKGRTTASLREVSKVTQIHAQSDAPVRPRIDKRKGKNSEQNTDTDFRRAAFDAYLSTGGNLKLERQRGALASNVTTLLKAGLDKTTILAACRDLGRNNEFPGLLKQRTQEINARGGPCENESLDRSRLTPTQLIACGCPRCEEWNVALQTVKNEAE